MNDRTLRYWLDPERERERRRERYADHRERRREHQRERYANDPDYRERKREREREYYWNLSGFEYNRFLLRQRRNKARSRIATRNEGRPEEPARKRQARAEAQRKAERLLAEEIQRRQEATSG